MLLSLLNHRFNYSHGAGKDGGAVPLSLLQHSPDGFNGSNSRHDICRMHGKGLESVEVGMEHQTPHCCLCGNFCLYVLWCVIGYNN